MQKKYYANASISIQFCYRILVKALALVFYCSVTGRGNSVHTSSPGLSTGKVFNRLYLLRSTQRCPSKNKLYLLWLSISVIMVFDLLGLNADAAIICKSVRIPDAVDGINTFSKVIQLNISFCINKD